MFDINRETYEKKNGIETIVYSNGILGLKHTEEGLDHKKLQEITIKYH